MHIQVQLRTESFELCVFDCCVVLLCSWDVPDRLINCALDIKKLKTTGAGDANKDKEASQFTFIFIVSFPCRWSFANFTRCSCHRKAKFSRVDMDREEDSVMEMNRPTWWELLWTWDECDLCDIHIIKYASSESQLAFYNRHDRRL